MENEAERLTLSKYSCRFRFTHTSKVRLVPAKSNLPHPIQGDYAAGDRMYALKGAIPVYINKGDALLFADGIMHGFDSRVNQVERRITIYRYGCSQTSARFGYEYSESMLNRLFPERRKILQPIPPIRPPKD